MDHTKYPNSLNKIVITSYFLGSFTHGLDCYLIAHACNFRKVEKMNTLIPQRLETCELVQDK